MKAVDCRETVHFDMIGKVFADIPDDLMVIAHGDKNVLFCHSEQTGKYYTILHVDNENNKTDTLLFADTWLEGIRLISDDGQDYLVPFTWGEQIKHECGTYTPFFELVETGETTPDGFPIWKREYRILYHYCYGEEESKVNSRFETEKYGKLLDMVAQLQRYTHIVF